MLSTWGIEQVVHTNCLVWILPEQIESLIVFFHSNDCINHTFGSIIGQDDSYFTNLHCIISGRFLLDDCELVIEYIQARDHQIFGPGTHLLTPCFVTETERKVEAKLTVKRMANKLLTKMGNIGGTGTMKGFILKGSFLHIFKKLCSLEPSFLPSVRAVQCGNKLQPILHGNMTLETKSLPNRVTSLTAKTPSELATMKRYFSQMIGTGLKKSAPSTKEVAVGLYQFAL